MTRNHRHTLTTRRGHDFANQLLAYWNLDEASGTRLSLRGNYPLSDVNTVGSATGQLSLAASFVGANQERLANSSTDFDLANLPWAVSLWCKTNAVNGALFAKAASGDPAYECYINGSGNIDFYWRNAANTGWYVINGGNVNNNQWHHVVCDFNGLDTLRVTIDAGTPASGTVNGGRNSAGDFTVGAYIGTVPDYYTGLIDELAFRVGSIFSPAEIQLLYNSGNPPAYPFQ